MAGTGTLTVTPDTSGTTINTLPPSGQATPANSLPMVLDTTVEGTLGTSTAGALTIQGGTGGLPVIVSGGAAAGAAPNNPPLSASGIDDGGLKRHLLTDSFGALRQAASGAGGHTAVPAGSTNGTAIGTRPASYVRGVLLELQAGDSVTFSVQATQPTAAPLTRTLAVPTGGLLSQYFADLAPGVMLYVTAVSGSPLFRWI